MDARGSVRVSLVRHQLASLVATAVDFTTMVLLVELAKLDPSVATLAGATFGAVVNFTLNRRYTFGVAHEAVAGQALRYASVSAASALLNAVGERVAVRFIAAPYLAARVVIAFLVGVGWNYPMHRSFVFGLQRTRA